jgi:hypothetical protein
MFAMVLKHFSGVIFKCFIYLHTYVASVASVYFKSKSGVAHGMRVRSGRGRAVPTCSLAVRALRGT